MRHLLVLFALALGLLGCTAPQTAPPAPGGAQAADAEAAIRAVMDAQVEAWNAGDLRAFMDGYARTDSLRFASGGTVRYGWQAALDGYLQGYPDRAAMGTLAFTDLDVRPLGADHALVFGRWHLDRTGDAPDPGGLFTLLFERRPDGWRIVHDHTSSAD